MTDDAVKLDALIAKLCDDYHKAGAERDALREQVETLTRTQDERSAWLAAFVVERMGGTNDLPAWVRRSAEYWHAQTQEILAFDARATKAEAERDARPAREPTPAMCAAGFAVSEAEHDPAGVWRAMYDTWAKP